MKGNRRAPRSSGGSGGNNRVMAGIVIVLCLIAAIYVFPFQSDEPHGFRHESQAQVGVDMHTHTTDSDGDFTPTQVIDFATSRGLTSVWITDHDMIRPITRTQELLRVASLRGINLGFGVEITVGWLGKEHHLLGYFPNSVWRGRELAPEMQSLAVACAQVKKSREDRNNALVAWLNHVLQDPTSRSVYFTDKESEASYQPVNAKMVGDWALANAGLTEVTSLGRPHFRGFLKNQRGVRDDLIFGPRAGNGEGVVTSDGAVYWDADADGKDGHPVEALLHSATLAKRDIAFRPLPINDAIDMIRKAGGKAVLAHLPTLGRKWKTKFLPALSDLASAGLWGVEAYSAEISEEDHAQIMQAIEAAGLHSTGGSDSHGTLKPYAHLGDVWRSKLTFTESTTPGRYATGSTKPYNAVNTWGSNGAATSAGLRGGKV